MGGTVSKVEVKDLYWFSALLIFSYIINFIRKYSIYKKL